MAENTILITGATGLVGTEVVAHLLQTTPYTIYVLVRADNDDDAERRLRALWADSETLTAAVGKRVLPLVGDITQPITQVPASVTHVIHSAAETGVQKSRQELRHINVDGTRNVVEMAEALPLLKRFTYISTAYVAGMQNGRIAEAAPLGHDFYTHYEQSKADAERIVRASALPFIVCRPGMIVGNSETGRTTVFNTVYYVLKLILQGKMRVMPVSPKQTVNVVPVDYVARLVAELTLNSAAVGRTFHLTAPHSMLPTVGELVEVVRAWGKAQLGISVPKPFYLSMPLLRKIGRRYNAGNNEKKRNLLSNLTALMPYFFDDHVFDRANTDLYGGAYNLDWRTFVPHLLDYACRHNFMRLSGETIFQQAVTRRASKRYPVSYYNITANGLEHITGSQMNAMVYYYVEKLKTIGVKAGDKVALSGVNCAEHAAIDNAIGLVGAVSVPIYYTTPADELALLMKKSGARWFFVGDERVMKNTDRLSVQIIKFGPLITQHSTLNTQHSSLNTHHSTLNTKLSIYTKELATIRYTSGTTGEPKGVMFNFQQLKWMGEVLTNLLSWRDRNSEMRYLSFLPMSHVVEGILAAYAPYCMLCKAKIYYLTDFQLLASALPKVRPTVFFSVPRFYEKLWEQIEQNALGRRYLAMSDGWLKRCMAGVLRRAVLRKAGLDKCHQLLVGSAPISEALLRNFRQLGIEIHNAYGQTEAPLITLNRMGHNVIPSIGQPLPDTHVTVAPDGELIVTGPQVALGYYQLESSTFKDGQLCTGDLGQVDAEGNVYISGRKKDMLITSYGKNINCTKIEQLLLNITGVEQAVLVGEQRPFCTALLWTADGTATGSLTSAIERMNTTLSHPEQVKRFKVIGTPLSIGRGELTPSLKVKRQVVIEHYQQAINELYV